MGKVRIAIKTLIYLFFFGVYLANHTYLPSLTQKIERELLKKQYYIVIYDELSPTPKIIFDSPPDAYVPEAPDEQYFYEEIPIPIEQQSPPSTQIIEITETQLWQSFLGYRTSHQIHTINQSEALCIYARKRAQELFDRMEQYPNDPLDDHAGFKRDADSGYVFETTGFMKIGENLAFVPGFTSATQIIEWGWDTSQGHRDLQLSSTITDGCITGIHPVYVGIFAE